jgi:TetR/AcrR family transcriptional regulator, copper-responsive repressor
MGRPKQFSRDGVLAKAFPVFWRHGFADTSVQQLEQATGVNKSGLYTEFAGKEDLFVQSLRYYLDEQDKQGILTATPLGWRNVERFLRLAPPNADGQRGCFSVSCMRELPILPPEAAALVAQSRAKMKRLLVQNIDAERPTMAPDAIAELVLTFFTGLSMEHHLKPSMAAVRRKIDSFMQVVRSL